MTATTGFASDRSLEHRYADVNGVRLHYVVAGDGPLVVLLHGFPEFWYTWRHQIPALAAAGFRVVAVDLRGYNLSGKPEGVAAYGIKTVVEDIAALVKHLGASKASFVGHDWGAGVVWTLAMMHPELVERIAVLNGPHPERMLQAMKNPLQLLKSWYVFFFQLPLLPEAYFRSGHFAVVRRALREEPRRHGAYDDADIARYVEAFSQPGAVTAMINYYRAMFRRSAQPKLAPIDTEVLVVWGEDDPHLRRELAQPSPRWVPNVRLAYVPGASHWVQHDEPERVNSLLLEFLKPKRRVAAN
jgi:pimeloyl-ACP methyl ester carboxylesterase